MQKNLPACPVDKLIYFLNSNAGSSASALQEDEPHQFNLLFYFKIKLIWLNFLSLVSCYLCRGPEYYRQPAGFEPVRAVSSQADTEVLAPKRPRMMAMKSEVETKPIQRSMPMSSERVAQPVSHPEIKKVNLRLRRWNWDPVFTLGTKSSSAFFF